jgi:hypothetical protein
MRLTLRTLLAYLDDVLEPAQAKALGEKIAESSVATSLVNRIREVLRRRRLGAPGSEGTAVGLDENRVAEYLDNTLGPDAVADVERVCLESDLHLAEVAACHQVLTLVLGEPVDIPMTKRERMYALGAGATQLEVPADTPAVVERPSAPIQPVAGVSGQSRAVQQSGVVPRGPVEVSSLHDDFRDGAVPEYLRDRRTWKDWWPYGALAAVGLLWAGLIYVDPPIAPKPSPGTLANQAAEMGEGVDVPLVADADPEPALIDDGPPASATTASPSVPPPPTVTSAEPRPAAQAPRGSPVEVTLGTDVPAPAGEAVATATPEPKPASRPIPPDDVDLRDRPPTEVAAATPPPVAPTKPAEKPLVETPSVPAPTEKPEPVVDMPIPPVVKYTSNTGVAALYDPRENLWKVLPRDRTLHAGDVVAVPEPFEGRFDVGGADESLVVPAGTTLIRLGLNPAAPHGWALVRGRYQTTVFGGKPSAQALQVRDRLWKLEVLAPDTQMVVAMKPREPRDFEEVVEGGTFKVALALIRGAVRVSGDAGKPVTLENPAWLSLTPGLSFGSHDVADPAQPDRLDTAPSWLVGDANAGAARNYAKLMEDKFYDRALPVEQTITGAVEDKRFLVSRLAVDCLAQIQAIELLVDILQRTEHDESRRSAIAALRAWLPETEEHRAELRAHLARRFTPADSDTIYRLLWGYGDKHFRDVDTSRQLIEWLRHDNIAVRELAYIYVKEGLRRDFDYRPSGNPSQRQSAVTRLLHQLRGGPLTPKEPNAVSLRPAG